MVDLVVKFEDERLVARRRYARTSTRLCGAEPQAREVHAMLPHDEFLGLK